MIQTAKKFAELLDNGRYDEAAQLMSPDCRYKYWEGVYQGPTNIANMYKQMKKQALEILNECTTTSEIERVDDRTFVVHASDTLRIAELTHRSRYDEVLTVEDDMITAIEYREVAGEAEKMHEFYTAAGLSNR